MKRWTRDQLDSALIALDTDVERMLERSGGVDEFWAVFDDAASELQMRSGRNVDHVTVQIRNILARHGLTLRSRMLLILAALLQDWSPMLEDWSSILDDWSAPLQEYSGVVVQALGLA